MDAAASIEVLRDSSDFTALTCYTKAFDLFRVMGVSSKELVHSNITASFLNANEAHGLGGGSGMLSLRHFRNGPA